MTREEEINELLDGTGNSCWPYLTGEKEWPPVKEASKEVEQMVITTRDIKTIPDRDKQEPVKDESEQNQ